jgi:hypothetical protein
MDHGTLRQLAAGAALNDLDPAERREFDAHIRWCVACTDLARDLDDVLGELALATPEMAAPPALRYAVLRALPGAAHGPSVAPAQPAGADRTLLPFHGRGPRPSRSWVIPGLAAAVLAIAVVGLGARTLRLSDELAAGRSRVAQQAAAMAVITDPAHRTASLSAEPAAPVATAVVVYRPGTSDAYVMADHLPATPAGMVYQLWYADAAGVHPLETFRYDGDGPFLAPFGVDLGASAATMITLEPEGGATGEPGPQVVFGKL